MKANTSRFSLLAAILTVALMFSLFSISVFAETEAGSDTASTTAPSTETAAGSETKAPETETGKEESATETSKESEATTEKSPADKDKEKEDLVATIVSLSILGVIAIVITVICIVKREKVGKLFRNLKSESRKVVWLPWSQVRKNTLVVIVVVAVFAIAIGILDFAFSKGIIAFGELF